MTPYFNACFGGEEGPKNVTYLFLKFLMVIIDPLNAVSHNVAVYKNLTTTLNEALLYCNVRSNFRFWMCELD
jgi:hypothetical protein